MKERLALESVAVPYRKRGWWSGKSSYASVSSEPQVFLFHPCNVTHRNVFRTFIQPTWNGPRKKEKGKERRTKPSTLVVMATCTISIRAAITYRPGNCPARLQLSRKKAPVPRPSPRGYTRMKILRKMNGEEKVRERKAERNVYVYRRINLLGN